MQTIYEIIHAALAPLGVPVMAETFDTGGAQLPDEFISYQIVSEVPIEYADNGPLFVRYMIDVLYVTRSGASKARRAREIRAALEGFIWQGGSDLPRESGSPFYGYTQEFSIVRRADDV